jgi:agmatine deiminase
MTSTAYRLPAEWSPHRATWLAWPHNADDWPGRFEPIPWVYVEIVKRLSRVEDVHILVQDAAAETDAAARLERGGADGARVRFHHVPTDRVWTRDFAPFFVKDAGGAAAAVKWRFNAWAKYDNHERDEEAGHAIARLAGLPAVTPEHQGRPIVLEGGSIDVNGEGTLLTTEECLLSDVQARNPGLSRQDLEQVFATYLGVRKTLWLKRGIAGDDTHGHIDDLARFVDPTTVVVVIEDDKGDDNHEPLRENLERLRSFTDQDGRPLRVVSLPMPAPIFFDGQRLPASYANFYIANRLVLVPTFNDERDRDALATLAGLLPGRSVIGIHCGDLVWGLGTLHCMTMQQT